MSSDEDGTLRPAITNAFDGCLVGDYLIVASVYATDGGSRIAVYTSDDMSLHSQLGLLTSALNRANAIDIEGWGCDDCD